jgi:ClpP class serine protease
MEVPAGRVGEFRDGQPHFFCGRECALRFDLLGSAAPLRAEVIKRRARIIDAIEAERGSQVITLIHRHELWDAKRKEGYITMEDSEAVVAAIRGAGSDTPIDLIVHTPGGLALAAELIAMALKHHEAPTTVMVPFYAMSGGSMVAVAADEILMGQESILGPLDPQIQGHSAGSLLRLLRPKACGSDYRR